MLVRRLDRLPAAPAFIFAALMITGCSGSSQPDNVPNSQADSAAAAAALALAAQKNCITNAVNDAVVKQQDDAATQAALDQQDLTNCPTDFVSSFVALRTSVRNYLQTRREIVTHNGQANEAVGSDGLNLACSFIAGKQCAPSAIVGWANADTELKNRDAANRAAYQSARADLETVIARYGVYIKTSDPSDTANATAPSDGNMM